MTTTEHPDDPPDFDPLMDTPITRVKIAVPWWTRVSAATLGVAVALALVVGIISQWQGVQNERRNAAFARDVAAANVVATEKARAETDCVRNRNADLTRVSSQLVGLTAKLFVRLAQRDPTLGDQADPIYAEFGRLAIQRDVDDDRVARGVDECRQP